MPPTMLPPITVLVERTDLACILCSRVSGYLQDDRVGVHPHATAESVLALRCYACGGRLIQGERYHVRNTRPLVESERRVNQGRRTPFPVLECSDAVCMRPGADGGSCSLCRTRRAREKQRVGVRR